MDVRCPKCKTLYEFNELRIKGQGVSLKCSQCNHVFRVDNPDESDKRARRRWMIRKIASGDVLYFSGMSVLQKWIIDRKVSRDDEISKTGKTWKPLGSIGELSSFFQVAESIERLQTGDHPDLVPLADQRSAVPQGSDFEPTLPEIDLGVTVEARRDETTVPGYLATDGEGDLPYDQAKTREWDGAANTEEGPWALDEEAPEADSEPTRPEAMAPGRPPSPAPQQPVAKPTVKPDPPAPAPPKPASRGLEIDMSSELSLPRVGGPSRGTYDDPLDVGPRRSGPPVVPIVVVVLLLALVAAGAYVALMHPELLTAWGTSSDRGGGAHAPDTARAAADGGLDSVVPPEPTDVADPRPDAPETDEREDANPPVKSTAKDKRPSQGNAPMVGSYDGLMQRGYHSLRSGHGKQALDAFSAAFAKRGSSSEAASGMGWAYLALGNSNAAISSFKRSLGINPRYGDAQIGLGQAYRNTGNKAAALKAYQTYLRLYPNGPKASIAKHHVQRLERETAATRPASPQSADAGAPKAASDAGPSGVGPANRGPVKVGEPNDGSTAPAKSATPPVPAPEPAKDDGAGTLKVVLPPAAPAQP